MVDIGVRISTGRPRKAVGHGRFRMVGMAMEAATKVAVMAALRKKEEKPGFFSQKRKHKKHGLL
jgi:hypothetical protein